MKKKCIFLVVMTALSLSMYANGNQGQETGTDGSSVVTPAGEYPIVSEPIELRAFIAGQDWVEDYETNWFTAWYEEKTGVSLDIEVSTNETGQKISLMLASQTELPDFFSGYTGIEGTAVKVYGMDGVFLPLNDLIEEYGLNTKKFFEYDPSVEPGLSALDGNIYGLPRYLESYHVSMSQRAWINKDWLDNVGMDVPQTTEELYAALQAFKEQDANGNGDPNDEIPLSHSVAWQGNMEGFLMNPFVYDNAGGGPHQRFFLENNIISASFAQDEYRDGLKYANRLYGEGLIDVEAFTTTRQQIKSLVDHENGCMIGVVVSGAFGPFTDFSSTDTKNQFVSLPPLEGPTGIRQTPKYKTSFDCNQFMIPADSRYPEVAFRWADWFMTLGHDMGGNVDLEEMLEKHRIDGEPGVDWNGQGMEGWEYIPALAGGEAWWERILGWGGQPQNKHWANAHPMVSTKYFGHNSTGYVPGEWNQLKEIYNALEVIEPYAVDKEIPNMNFTSEELTRYTEIRAILGDYIEQSYAKFVTGQLDPTEDADWGRYTSELENIGLNEYVNLLQKAYDRQYK